MGGDGGRWMGGGLLSTIISDTKEYMQVTVRPSRENPSLDDALKENDTELAQHQWERVFTGRNDRWRSAYCVYSRTCPFHTG